MADWLEMPFPPSVYVKFVADCSYPRLFCGPRYLTLVKVYGDESEDDKGRVFTLAALVAEESEWGRLADRWKERCLRDGIECYHATDCAGQWAGFAHLTKTQCISLNADLITYITETQLWGFGVSISKQDYLAISRSSEEAKTILGSSPFFLAMQFLILSLCTEFSVNNPDYRMAFLFDQNESVSGQAKQIWDELRKKNQELANAMGSIAFHDKCNLVPLQIADEFAFEVMKNALAWTEGRRDRRPIIRMKDAKIIKRLDWLNKAGLEATVHQQRHSL